MPSGYYADVVNTSAANSFTRVQTFTPNAADIGSVSTPAKTFISEWVVKESL